jgi:tetratricopeptide (TPR) repeat protein
LKGNYHNQLAIIFKNLAAKEQKEDYLDRAFVEYEAASFHFEEGKHKRYLSHVENNLGFLFYRAGKYKEAHRRLDRARRLAESLKDRMHAARIDETRARSFSRRIATLKPRRPQNPLPLRWKRAGIRRYGRKH